MSYKKLLHISFIALFVTLFSAYSSNAQEGNELRTLEGQITCLEYEFQPAHPWEHVPTGHRVIFKENNGTLYFIVDNDKSENLFNFSKYNEKKVKITGKIKRFGYIEVEKFELI